MAPINRDEALHTARKMLRGFPGAPDPRQHAQRLQAELQRAEGWSSADQAAIRALGTWLQTRPAHERLRAHCAGVLARLR